ncbi:MAG: hypothetical protein EAZ97_14330, partial [Bacteroidetes bacterium]
MFKYIFIFLFFGLISCNKNISEKELLPNAPSNSDLNGQWKTVLVNLSEITVANPQATTSADYQSELAEVKQAQAQLSEQQNATIK